MKKHIKNWIYNIVNRITRRIKTFFKLNKFDKGRLYKLIKNVLSILGGLYTSATIIDFVDIIECVCLDFYKDNFIILVVIMFIIALVFSLKWGSSYTYKLCDKDINITLKIDDIVYCKNDMVISTNTSFITTMEDKIISQNSVQGAFQNKFYFKNLIELDEVIENSLIGYESCNKLLDIKGKKYKIYDIGTVIKIKNKKRFVYFLAVSHINSKGKCISNSDDDIIISISSLWEYLSNNGHVEAISIPLIGSGKMGISNNTKERIIKELIDTFIYTSINKKISDNLIIYIFPDDLNYINLDDILEYLNYKCKFDCNIIRNEIGRPIKYK